MATQTSVVTAATGAVTFYSTYASARTASTRRRKRRST